MTSALPACPIDRSPSSRLKMQSWIVTAPMELETSWRSPRGQPDSGAIAFDSLAAAHASLPSEAGPAAGPRPRRPTSPRRSACSAAAKTSQRATSVTDVTKTALNLSAWRGQRVLWDDSAGDCNLQGSDI